MLSILCALALSLPELEASASFHSMKVERGMCENPDPIVGLEAEIEWYGIFTGIEALYDVTDRNERRWKYNEISPFVGYKYEPFDWLEAGLSYRFKKEPDDHTHEITPFIECPFALATPFAAWEIDVYRDSGALYGVIGIEREFAMLDWLSLNLDVGFGYGNAKRNNADFERNAIGARDVHMGCELSCRICEHLKICPYCRFYQQLTEKAREEYNCGFYVDGGVAIVCEL